MIMDKTSNSGDDNGVLHNVEGFVLDRLLSKQDSGGDPLIDIGDLMESIDTTMSPLLDQSIEGLIAQGLIHSPDGESYQITQDGINELENRKRGNTTLTAILFLYRSRYKLDFYLECQVHLYHTL
jgi:hypothetical protein